jgi:adenylate cyclase
MAATETTPKRRFFWIGLAIGIVVIFISLVLFQAGLFDIIEQKSIDWRFLIRGEMGADPRIVIVSIDESSFSDLNQTWPWPRIYFARLIDRLAQEGVKTIGIDIIMSEPYPGDQDEVLARSARRFGHVVFPSKFEQIKKRIPWAGKEVELTEEVLKGPIRIIADSGDVGFINLPHDDDGFVRRFVPIRPYQEEPYASHHLKLIAQYLGISMRDVVYCPYEALQVGEWSVPLSLSDSAYINFAGPSGKFQKISFSEVLNGHFPPGFFTGKIVLVGATFLDSHDFFPTPFMSPEGGDRYLLSGVEIHANIINTFLQNRFIRVSSPVLDRLVMVFGGLLVVFLSLKFGPLRAGLSVLAMVMAYLFTSQWVFHEDILLLTTGPVAAMGGTFLALVVFRYFTEEREKRRIRSMFQRYVSPDVVNKLIQDPSKLTLGGETRELTVLFSDIRGFTSMSERLPPDAVLNQLNEYLTAMTAIVLKNGGMLDKYVGDAIMAVFGAPLAVADHPLAACKTALEMIEELRGLQESWQRASKPVFDIGIGVHSGEMVIGNVGSPKRMDYTVIGDNVNLASRLEGVNKELGTRIIISGATYERVKAHVRVRDLGKITVKGKERAVAIHELVGMQ